MASSRFVFASASALAFALSVAAAPSIARADEGPGAPASNDSAQDHYTAGRESYRSALYGRALEEFERSLALAPSPNTRLYIARTLRELGRWSEAAEQYGATIREAGTRGGKYLATRDAANVELADVKLRLERATAGTKAEAGEKSDAAHGDEPAAATSAPAPAAQTSRAAEKDAPAAVSGAHRTVPAAAWISGGVAIAGAASFAVLYGLASSRFGYLEDNCARVRTSACDDARTTGKAEEIGAYASLGVAAVAAAITVYSLVSAQPAAARAGASRREPWRIAF
ncbi:MAG: hypothetical protein JWP87_242 [Labilithrix sp.]|nr:hypothetical protein [Labilithrix sp.]